MDHPCPNCGYCPHCGRKNAQPYNPYQPFYPGQPIWISTPITTTPNWTYGVNTPNITSTVTAAGGIGNVQ